MKNKIAEFYLVEAKRSEGPSYTASELFSLEEARNVKVALLGSKYFNGTPEFSEVKIYKQKRFDEITLIE